MPSTFTLGLLYLSLFCLYVALCCSISKKITVRTARVLTVVSLLMKLHSEGGAVVDFRGVVGLLGKMVLFPEWEENKEQLYFLYEEAKCQVRDASKGEIYTCICS